MNGKRSLGIALACLVFGICSALAQQHPKVRVRRHSETVVQKRPETGVYLRFDESQREEIADCPFPTVDSAADTGRPVACKLNRRRVAFEKAYDAVTLWNVTRVKVRNRRMRLSDTTARERVRLLKFFIERSRKRGVRPHLLGNVAGCRWTDRAYDPQNGCWLKVPRHISSYTLRSAYDSLRRAGGDEGSPAQVPDWLWRDLSPDAVYMLDGVRVSGRLFQFIDGLILRTLDIHVDSLSQIRFGAAVVVGDTYPDRVPLVVFDGEFSTVAHWLKLCRANAFSMTAEVPMRYFYMLPAEAVQCYGSRGMYGAICVEMAE